jgi:hypothetical protein
VKTIYELTIQAPINVVWTALTDLKQKIATTRALKHVEQLEGNYGEVGSTSLMVLDYGLLTSSVIEEIISSKYPNMRRVNYKSTDNKRRVSLLIHLVECGSGCTVFRLEQVFIPISFSQKLFLPITKRIAYARLVKGMHYFKRVLERQYKSQVSKVKLNYKEI